MYVMNMVRMTLTYEELMRCWVVGNKVSGEILCRIDVEAESAHGFSDLDYIKKRRLKSGW